MRKISTRSILVFNSLLIIAILFAILITKISLSRLFFGDFTGLVVTFFFLVFFYLISIFIYRVFLIFFPLPEGDIKANSKQEFIVNVYQLFYLIPFHLLLKSQLIPVSLMRVVYVLLGAKMGANTYSSGLIDDPPLTIIGSNTLLGQDCLLTCHIIEGEKLGLQKIRIGNNVTIGAKAVIMAGVTIGDNAIIGAGAVVIKGTKIGAKEVWGGIPAKKIR